MVRKTLGDFIALNFAEKFCIHFHIAPEAYESVMLRRTLYLPGRWLRFFIGSNAFYFWPDRDFIRGVGQLGGLHEFEAEMAAFTLHPQNARFFRRHLKLRVSAKKVYVLMREVMKPDAPSVLPGGSGKPFEKNTPTPLPSAPPPIAPWTDSRTLG